MRILAVHRAWAGWIINGLCTNSKGPADAGPFFYRGNSIYLVSEAAAAAESATATATAAAVKGR